MLAQMNERIGNYGRAIDLIEQALALSQQQYGIKVQLAETYFKAGEFEKGREMLRTMIPKGERTPEETSPFAKYFIQKIGDSYHQEGRYEEAIATLRAARAELLAADEEPYDFMMMRVVLKLARSLGKVGKYEEALQVIKSYRDEMPEEMGPKNRIRLCCDAETGVVLLMANKPNEAEAMFRSVVTSGVQLLHGEFLIKQWRLAMYEAGLEDEMLETIDQELKSYKRRFTPGSIQHAMQLRTLGYDLIDLGQRKRACELLTQSVALLKDQDPVPFNLAITQFDVARLMMELESADETKATKHENDLENAWTSLVALTPDALPIEKKAMRLSLEDLIQICEKNEAEEMAETWRIRIQNL